MGPQYDVKGKGKQPVVQLERSCQRNLVRTGQKPPSALAGLKFHKLPEHRPTASTSKAEIIDLTGLSDDEEEEDFDVPQILEPSRALSDAGAKKLDADIDELDVGEETQPSQTKEVEESPPSRIDEKKVMRLWDQEVPRIMRGRPLVLVWEPVPGQSAIEYLLSKRDEVVQLQRQAGDMDSDLQLRAKYMLATDLSGYKRAPSSKHASVSSHVTRYDQFCKILGMPLFPLTEASLALFLVAATSRSTARPASRSILVSMFRKLFRRGNKLWSTSETFSRLDHFPGAKEALQEWKYIRVYRPFKPPAFLPPPNNSSPVESRRSSEADFDSPSATMPRPQSRDPSIEKSNATDDYQLAKRPRLSQTHDSTAPSAQSAPSSLVQSSALESQSAELAVSDLPSPRNPHPRVADSELSPQRSPSAAESIVPLSNRPERDGDVSPGPPGDRISNLDSGALRDRPDQETIDPPHDWPENRQAPPLPSPAPSATTKDFPPPLSPRQTRLSCVSLAAHTAMAPSPLDRSVPLPLPSLRAFFSALDPSLAFLAEPLYVQGIDTEEALVHFVSLEMRIRNKLIVCAVRMAATGGGGGGTGGSDTESTPSCLEVLENALSAASL